MTQILVAEGDVVPVGTVLVVIGGTARAAEAAAGRDARAARPAPTAQGDKVRATPLVRRLAQELGVDLAAVAGTGPQGRITEDGRARHARRAAVAAKAAREPIRGVKRQMFEHLTRAHREIPPVTWVEECDFTDVDLKLLLPLVLKAVAASLQEFPELNARVDGNELVYLDRYDIGIAVQTEQVSSSRSCATATRVRSTSSTPTCSVSPRPHKPASSRRRSFAAATFTVTSAGKLGGSLRRRR